ncbi:uncharacterized protein ARMOST_10587 [Armillaria ostoyae]|uniref:Uncharacterized protein n=1 Tax=Armillaria ostoyae TaxID=47428 RepID=A0A284RES5_ARMOS|nr:uncharacterized protein ARMOST_10587 [Armillaria ostoyae]
MDVLSKPDNPYNLGTSLKSATAAKQVNLIGSNTVASSSKLPPATPNSLDDTPGLSARTASTQFAEFSAEPFPSDPSFNMQVNDPPHILPLLHHLQQQLAN